MEIYAVFVIILAILFVLMARNHERKTWNNGVCPNCCSTWEIFDVDSQGGRGYKCACRRYIWISYAVDR